MKYLILIATLFSGCSTLSPHSCNELCSYHKVSIFKDDETLCKCNNEVEKGYIYD